MIATLRRLRAEYAGNGKVALILKYLNTFLIKVSYRVKNVPIAVISCWARMLYLQLCYQRVHNSVHCGLVLERRQQMFVIYLTARQQR